MALKLPFVHMQGERSRPPDEPFRIAYFARDNSGCTYYRAILPLNTLAQQGLTEVMCIERGEDTDRIAHALAYGDVIVFPRLSAGANMLKVCTELKRDGKLLIVDFDDNIFQIGPLSPHYIDFGTDEHNYRHPSKGWIPLWKDGVDGFSIAKNRERLNMVEKALAEAHLVTTTTEILANEFRRYNPNVVILPNCVDLRRWRRAELRPHADFRIFWAGGSSHYEDWLVLENVLPVILKKFSRARLIVMGVKFSGALKQLPADRVEFVPWEDNLSYPLRCALIGADLAIIPLTDTPFNACKSPIKWVEQSALEIPSVISHVSPYTEIYDGENAVMVRDNDPDAWVEAITTMILDPVLRARIAGNARRTVEQHFDIQHRAVRWLEAYQAAMQTISIKETTPWLTSCST